jgi:hypothetical protein
LLRFRFISVSAASGATGSGGLVTFDDAPNAASNNWCGVCSPTALGNTPWFFISTAASLSNSR